MHTSGWTNMRRQGTGGCSERKVQRMTEQQAKLHQFFSDKAKHLQNEIDLEIAKIGRMQEEERKALAQLREEAEYYRLALDVLGE